LGFLLHRTITSYNSIEVVTPSEGTPHASIPTVPAVFYISFLFDYQQLVILFFDILSYQLKEIKAKALISIHPTAKDHWDFCL